MTPSTHPFTRQTQSHNHRLIPHLPTTHVISVPDNPDMSMTLRLIGRNRINFSTALDAPVDTRRYSSILVDIGRYWFAAPPFIILIIK